MNTHKHARLTIYGRDLLVRRILEHGQRPVEAIKQHSFCKFAILTLA